MEIQLGENQCTEPQQSALNSKILTFKCSLSFAILIIYNFMNILSLENVSKNYGIKPLFENVTIGLEDSDKIGIIGANGSGKTTLLRVIAGKETPDTGRIVRAASKNVAYLSQNPQFIEEATVLETIFASSSRVMKLIQDYETACHDLADRIFR